MERLKVIWKRVENHVSKRKMGRKNRQGKEEIVDQLDKLLDITTCKHTIKLCDDDGSGCVNRKECKRGAHINCSCPKEMKIPVLELKFLYSQRNKVGEHSDMMISGIDLKETERQNKAAKQKIREQEAEMKKKRKEEQIVGDEAAR